MNNDTDTVFRSDTSSAELAACRMRAQTAASEAVAIRIWSPGSDQIQGLLGESIATSLAAAFSSGEWAPTPMPIGDRTDPHSARGILSALEGRSHLLLASVEEPGISRAAQRVVGCVLGGCLDEELIAAYGLTPYGARSGDGLLAYIGVVPSAQGVRLRPDAGGPHEQHRYRPHRMAKCGSMSLARVLFSGWLALPGVSSCPTVFVRTRQVLKPILHLAAEHGFVFSGSFTVDFQGAQQDRMVFRRENR